MGGKKVNGLSVEATMERVFYTAMKNGYEPQYVQRWRDWFDAQPEDVPLEDAPEYYMGDIQEVVGVILAMVQQRVEDNYGRGMPPLVVAILDECATLAASPEYVRGLVG